MPGSQGLSGSKGLRTRAAILDAASRRFEEHGYEGATIRAIANDANIDPSMVIRYFGSKEELFLAASTLDLELVRFENVHAASLGMALAEHFVTTWESSELGGPLRVLLSSALSNPEAADRMRNVFFQQVLPAVSAVRENAEVCAAFIASQVLGFALCRYVLAIAPMANLGRDEAIDWLGSGLQHHLDHRR
jgi:AcrR family transcriptional regulator